MGVDMRHSFKWVFLFFFIVGCNSNVNNPKIPADQDIIDVAQISLTNALVNHDIPDYGLITDPKNVILEDTLLLPGMVPVLDGIKITVMSSSQIQEKANNDSSFIYLQFLKIEKDSLNRVVVELATTWAASNKTPNIIYLSGGYHTYLFTKTDGIWKKELLATWIS